MSVKIGHARQDENGGIEGKTPGDQTGKEILVENWYARTGGWTYYLECTDAELADRAASLVEAICADAGYGYSQGSKQRWAGYHAIVANGGKVAGAAGDFDCSSLCIAAYILAGLDVEPTGYTGSIRQQLMATGKFTSHKDHAHLTTPDYARRGGLYLTPGKHVAMVLTDGAAVAEPLPATGEQTVVVVGGTVHVRTGGATSFPKLFTAQRGARFVRTGAAESGWHRIQTDRGVGYITQKPRYTRVE